VTAVDEYTASTYGTVGYTQESETFIPFADLTEATVVGWVKESLGEDTVRTHWLHRLRHRSPCTDCWDALVGTYSARFINQRRNTMSEKKTASIVIDDVEYTEDELSR
jgi:hypothetical protein